jgi:DNA mismatch repair ATPase MutS
VRSALERLADPRAAYLVDLVFGTLPRRPALWWMFPVLTAGSVTTLVLFLSGVWPAAAAAWIAICVGNVAVQVTYRPRVRQFVPALHELAAFLDVAERLAEAPIDALADERRALREGVSSLRSLRRATWWLRFEPGQTNEMAASAYEYVNLALLLDVNAFVLVLDTLRERRTSLRAAFEAIGSFDAARSVGAWRRELGQWSTPEFTDRTKQLRVTGLVHPLVPDPVANDLDVDDAGVLITGSNMSGKSTFVRALGVGAVLAQTVHTVCGSRWEAPLLRVRSSIGRSDSIVDGKSYYLAEAESVRALVRASEREEPHLFLLDEIFRGTNTTERVAAGYAVLRFLNRGPHLVVVATHDLELLDLLGDSFDAHHFREQVADGSLTFDFRLRPGPSSTRNAIALLQVLQYPAPLVAEALDAVDWQRRAAAGQPGAAG